MSSATSSRGTHAARIAAAGAWAAVAFLAPCAYRAPAADSPGFTLASAEHHLRAIVEPGPRPRGSEANARAREYVLEQLRASGFETRLQSTEICGERYGTCATVNNVIGELAGEGDAAVLLSAHYDTVPEGPGAGDDGAGVAAVLEVAATLATERPHRNSLVVLVDDCEELGLLGAEAFAQDPAFDNVRAAVNLEGRGTRGPSLMFETGRPNGIPLEAFSAAPRPMGNSVAATVYEALPNDTDFTVFKEAGITGLNFAFIDGAQHYHTQRDDLNRLDRASLRHHGDNALASVRRLLAANLERDADHLIFFDFYSLFVVRYPEWLALPIASVSLLLSLILAGWAFRRRTASVREILGGLGSTVGLPVVAALIGGGLLSVLGALGAPVHGWTDRSGPLVVAHVLVGLAAAFAFGVLARKARPEGMMAGVLIAIGLGSTMLAVTVPGASYLTTLPLVVALVAASLRPIGAAASPILAAGLAMLLGPVMYFLYDAVAGVGAVAAGALLAVALTPLVPHLPRGRLGGMLAGAALTGALLTTAAWVALV